MILVNQQITFPFIHCAVFSFNKFQPKQQQPCYNVEGFHYMTLHVITELLQASSLLYTCSPCHNLKTPHL